MSWKNIKGQDRPIEFLKAAIKSARLAHAYLFIGPESVGKALAARTLAKALNCERKESDSCDECPSCRKIDKEIHPDVNWIRPEGAGGFIKIERIRWLKKAIGLKPYEARTKFYIIDNAHKMNDEAANSLLKALEEPPPSSILILISAKPEALFYTIKSRCQIVRFAPMSSIRLEKLLEDEYNMDEDTSHFLAYFSSGRIGKAIASKERNALEWKNQIIDSFPVNIDNFLIDGGKEYQREDILEMLDILAIWYRDILVLKSAGGDKLVISRDRINDLNSLTGKFSRETLLDILDEIKKAGFLIQQNVNPKLAIASLVCNLDQPQFPPQG